MTETGQHNKILIVEDHPEVRKLLLIALQDPCREFLVAGNGEEAISQARREKPDLILLDVMMPGGMNGFDVTRILKQDPVTAGCPIITMTAQIEDRDRALAIESGADDYIGKPFDLSELRKKILRLLPPS
ncbi:MAG: response regulator [Deltaproteobacteria bacterium]|nr:response regulator [Deltaproteobacteria bacterium]